MVLLLLFIKREVMQGMSFYLELQSIFFAHNIRLLCQDDRIAMERELPETPAPKCPELTFIL